MESASGEKKGLSEMSKISLTLERYEDIFSSFDSRHYSQRLLSDDFLIEARKVTKETPKGEIELNLLMPENKRNAGNEAVIKKRLKDHFTKSYEAAKKEHQNIVHLGIRFAIVGIMLMFVATFIFFYYPDTSFFLAFVVVLLEPGGWFLLWEGLNQIVFESKQRRPELRIHRKMARCRITFHSY